MKLLVVVVVMLAMQHGEAVTCSPKDFAEEYCSTDNTYIVELVIEGGRKQQQKLVKRLSYTTEQESTSPTDSSTRNLKEREIEKEGGRKQQQKLVKRLSFTTEPESTTSPHSFTTTIAWKTRKPKETVTVAAKITQVYKGKRRRAKGKNIFLRSDYGIYGIGYKLTPGTYIVGFYDEYPQNLEGSVQYLQACAFFYEKDAFESYKIGANAKAFFKRAKKQC